MTPHGHTDLNSYVKNLRVLVFQTDGQMDRQTDGQTETLIQCGLGNLLVPSGKLAVHRLEELFSAVLEKFLKPIHALGVYCKN
jgi:hypothetical protein